MRVSASSIISKAADTQPMPVSAYAKRGGRSLPEGMPRRSLASGTWSKLARVPPSVAPPPRTTNHFLVCALSWAVPGAAHLWLGHRKGVIFLVALPLMFALGVILQGRIFPFDFSQPFVAL